MPRYREVVIKIPSAVQVEGPFAVVEAHAGELRIITREDEWLDRQQLLAIAERRARELRAGRRRRRLDTENS